MNRYTIVMADPRRGEPVGETITLQIDADDIAAARNEALKGYPELEIIETSCTSHKPLSNEQEPCFDIDLRWTGNADIPEFHEVITISYSADTKVTYTDLSTACVEQVEEACGKALERKRLRTLDHEYLRRIGEETGLDTAKMLEFYEIDSTAGLIAEMQKHIKQLIDGKDTRSINHHPVKSPRAG